MAKTTSTTTNELPGAPGSNERIRFLMGQLLDRQHQSKARELSEHLRWRQRILDLEQTVRTLGRTIARLEELDRRLRALEARSTSTGGGAANP